MQAPIKQIKLREQQNSVISRKDGEKMRLHLVSLLTNYEQIELDFTDLLLSPSFADSCVGILAKQLGKKDFELKILLTHTTSEHNSLLNHVIKRRLAEH